MGRWQAGEGLPRLRGLLCFRASNIIVVLDEESGIQAQGLAVAIRRLGG